MSYVENRLRNSIEKSIKKLYKIKKNKEKFIPGKTKIPYAGRVYDEKEIISAVDTVIDFWLTLGEKTSKFENKFSNYLGVENTIVVNSGSSANLLAISSLVSPHLENRLKKGDEVITTALTFPTTFNPIIQNNLVPVIVDVELNTLNVNILKLEQAISKKTKAIFLPHTLGNPFDAKEVSTFAKKHNLFFIEDTCDSLGSKYNGKFVGTFGDIATFSFYPAHHITMGEGGAIVTNNKRIKKIIKSLRDWGRDCFCEYNEANPLGACKRRFDVRIPGLPDDYDHRYVYTNIGYNLKPLDIQSAIGLEQLKKLPIFIKKRKENFEYLYKFLSRYEEYFILPESLKKANPCWFSFPITIRDNKKIKRKDLIGWVEKNNIMTRMIFAGNILRQPAYKNIKKRICGNLRNSDYIMENTFFIGVYPGLTKRMMEFITDKIKKFIKKL